MLPASLTPDIHVTVDAMADHFCPLHGRNRLKLIAKPYFGFFAKKVLVEIGEVYMDIMATPFVAVIGGLWQLDIAQQANAKTVGEQIGEELAKAGFGLVVYYSNEESLEPHVVTGYIRALPKGKGKIRVRFAESQRGKVKFKEEATLREIFEVKLFPGQDWEMPFYHSLAEEDNVDAVLLLGGATSTLIAGQIAIARKLPILAVDEFGGSAAKIWHQLAQGPDEMRHDSWGTTTPAALIQQLKSRCAARAAKRKDLVRRLALVDELASRKRQKAYAAGAFLVLIIVIFFGIVFTRWPSAYAFVVFIGLVTAGATGGVVRPLLWRESSGDPSTSLLLGSIAGLVVGFAYLVPQWVGAPGPLVPKVDVVSATDKIQFVSALLVAISAGVGFDTVFNRLKKQAQDVPIGPPQS